MHGDEGNANQNVKVSETLNTVIAALAGEQIAQGAIEAVYNNWHKLPRLQVWSLPIVAFFLLVTTLRVYHGNSVYLSREYHRWHHEELVSGALLSMPTRHSIDVFFHLLEYIALVGCGFFISKDPTLIRTGVFFAALLLIDILWTIPVSLKQSRQNKQLSPEIPAVKRWLIINSAICAGLIPFLIYAYHNELPCIGLVLAFFIFADSAIDYGWNYNHYFEQSNPAGSIQIRQSCALMNCLTKLSGYRQIPLKGKDDSEKLKERLDLIMCEIWQKESFRTDLFCRPAGAVLHLAIYIAYGDVLRPIYRCANARILTNNKTYNVGSSYVGAAYSRLHDAPEQALLYPRRQDEKLDVTPSSDDIRQYQSSVLSNIFWPPNKGDMDVIGTLNITSSQPDYFTHQVHELLAINIAREIAHAFHAVFGPVTTADLKAKIQATINGTPMITFKGERG